MKSLKRGSRLITLMISVFIIGMIVLIAKIQMEASFYISNTGNIRTDILKIWEILSATPAVR